MSKALGLFFKGGLVMYPLLLCSIFVIAIAIERWLYYRRIARAGEEIWTKVKEKIQSNGCQQALRYCEELGGPVADMLAAGLSFSGKDRAGIKEIMEEEALNQISELKARLGYLDTIVTLAPLLGLLGTVTGMINSFSVLDVSSGKPFAITGGVAEALIATATGLAIAIVALLFYSYFTGRVDYFIFQMEKNATKYLNSLPGEGESK